MPAQNRVGRDDRRDVGQHLSTQPLSASREPPTLRIGQPQAPADELTPKYSVFLNQIGDDVLLLVSQPAGEHRENNPEACAIHDRASLHHRVRFGLQGRSADSWDITGSRSDASGRRTYRRLRLGGLLNFYTRAA